MTYKEIEKDGFKISEKVEMLLSSDSALGVSKSIGLGLIGYGEALERIRPDLLIVPGDRFEALAVATAALIARIPVAHIGGGEATYGLIDEAIRHAITKMSFLHFTATEAYRRTVIQLGEAPKRVFNVGTVGLGNIKEMKLLTKFELETSLDFCFGQKSVLVTFHPVTLERNMAGQQFAKLLKALDAIQDLKIIFTRPNADTDGRSIIQLMDAYAAQNTKKVKVFSSLGQLKYLSALKYVNAVVGNSSSGIIEAPSFGVPTVNIGDRQAGRIKAESILDCNPETSQIVRTINKALSPEFSRLCKHVRNPYYKKDTVERIYRTLKKNINGFIDIKKVFYSINSKKNS